MMTVGKPVCNDQVCRHSQSGATALVMMAGHSSLQAGDDLSILQAPPSKIGCAAAGHPLLGDTSAHNTTSDMDTIGASLGGGGVPKRPTPSARDPCQRGWRKC